jgi:signal transduction histidine kinase
MFADLEILCFGTAAVVETVLLLALVERRNWAYVTLWMLLFAGGTWMWHLGSFFYLLLGNPHHAYALQVRLALMTVMAAGLLLMPSALLHGMLRLLRTGTMPTGWRSVEYAILYAPLLCLVPIAIRLGTDRSAPFLALVEPFIGPYIFWIAVANLVSAAAAIRLRNSIALPKARLFFTWLAATLLAMAAVVAAVMLVAAEAWPSVAPFLILVVNLSPVLPVALFAYFLIRYRFVPIVLERTLVYGAILVALWLLYRVTMREVEAAVIDRYHIDFVMVEALAGIALILAYQPLRQRTAEALRYLMGSRVAAVRDQMRQLSVEMSQRAGQTPTEILDWFTAALARPLHVDFVAAWLFDGCGHAVLETGATAHFSTKLAAQLHERLSASGLHYLAARHTPKGNLSILLREAGASVTALIHNRDIRGLLLVGASSWHLQLGDEELNALVLLVDQLGSTLQNSLLQAERLAAERQALQNEKRSTLGLLAGSIAHEVKNPLSSIKTIAAVLAEQLGGDSPHAEDLRLILCEIDRLALTTAQLLEFARPAAGDAGHACLPTLIERTLQVMRHLARQKDVRIETRLAADLAAVAADEHSLREIFFNLLSNAIEAAGRGGCIEVVCRREQAFIVAEIRDDGPGIPAAVRDQMFQPFVTTKAAGTGLGLYVVGRRVRELGGAIECRSDSTQGTTFTVKLPAAVSGASIPQGLAQGVSARQESRTHDHAAHPDCR